MSLSFRPADDFFYLVLLTQFYKTYENQNTKKTDIAAVRIYFFGIRSCESFNINFIQSVVNFMIKLLDAQIMKVYFKFESPTLQAESSNIFLIS